MSKQCKNIRLRLDWSYTEKCFSSVLFLKNKNYEGLVDFFFNFLLQNFIEFEEKFNFFLNLFIILFSYIFYSNPLSLATYHNCF